MPDRSLRTESTVASGRTRAERYAAVQSLRAEGLLLREIGDRLGLAKSTVHDLLADPTGEKARARKDRYRTPCIDCGKPTSSGSA